MIYAFSLFRRFAYNTTLPVLFDSCSLDDDGYKIRLIRCVFAAAMPPYVLRDAFAVRHAVARCRCCYSRHAARFTAFCRLLPVD